VSGGQSCKRERCKARHLAELGCGSAHLFDQLRLTLQHEQHLRHRWGGVGCRNEHLQLSHGAVAAAAPLVKLRAALQHASCRQSRSDGRACCLSSSITNNRFFAISARSAREATHILK
jgi:hypothetical protein